jgi:4-amino-4-deoxy-L-arabinose transferase-like glycosyltransferase
MPGTDAETDFPRPWIAVLFLGAFAARFAAAAAGGLSKLNFGDSVSYLKAAQALILGRYDVAHLDKFFFRAPGYPAFLVVSTLGHPILIAVDKVWNALLGSCTVLLLTALASRLFRDRRVALTTGILAAIHPAFLYLCAEIQSEPLFIALLLGSGFLLLASTDRPSSGLALGSGCLLALSALTRPSSLALTPLLAAPLWDRRLPYRVRRAIAASGLVGFLVTLTPWTVRNAAVFHAFLPVNDAAGFAFYAGNSEWNLRYYNVRNRDEFRVWQQAVAEDISTRWADRIPGAGDPNPARRSRALLLAGIRWAADHPEDEVRLLGWKLLDWLRPWASPLGWSLPVVALTGLHYSLLGILAGIGLLNARRRGAALFAGLVLLISMLSHVILQVVWRYRMPYWDPILLLYGSSGAVWLYDRGRRTP